MKTYKTTIPQIVILLTLVCAVLSVYFRSIYREQPIMDERVYAYICTEEEGRYLWSDHYCMEKVQTLSDAFYSQVNHYKYINGRFVVHFIEQAFTGVWGIQTYNVLNALLFGLLVTLIASYSTDRISRTNPLTWVLILLSLLLFFPLPWRLWTSYNLAPNYLIPSVLTVAYLVLFWQLEQRKFTPIQLSLFCVLALLLGDSHEAFSIPLSGAMIIYGFIHIKHIFKRQMLFPILFLGIGTLIMVVSPGNWSRFGRAHTGGFIYPLSNGIDNILRVRFIWITLIALLSYWIYNRNQAKSFFKEHYLLFSFIGFGIPFSLVANTGPYTLTAVELISFILLLKLIGKVGWLQPRKVATLSSVILLAIVAFIQVEIAVYGKVQMKDYEEAIQEYITHDDGIYRKPNRTKPFYVRKYVVDWRTKYGDMVLNQNLQKDYNQLVRKPIPLIAEEYDALSDGTMFTEVNAFPGNSGFYGVSNGSGYWAKCDSIDIDHTEFIFHYQPVNLSTPGAHFCLHVKFLLFPDAYPRQEKVTTIERRSTRWGDFYFIPQPPVLQVEEITKVTVQEME